MLINKNTVMPKTIRISNSAQKFAEGIMGKYALGGRGSWGMFSLVHRENSSNAGAEPVPVKNFFSLYLKFQLTGLPNGTVRYINRLHQLVTTSLAAGDFLPDHTVIPSGGWSVSRLLQSYRAQQEHQYDLTRVIRLLAASQDRILTTVLDRSADHPGSVQHRETQSAVYATGRPRAGQFGAQPVRYLPAQLPTGYIISGVPGPSAEWQDIVAVSARSTDPRTVGAKHAPGVVPSFGIKPAMRYFAQPTDINHGAFLAEAIAPQYGKVQIYPQRAQTNILTAAQTPTGDTAAQRAGYIPVPVQLQPGQPTGYPPVQLYWGQPAGYPPAQGQPPNTIHRLVSQILARTITAWPNIIRPLRYGYWQSDDRRIMLPAKPGLNIQLPAAPLGTPAAQALSALAGLTHNYTGPYINRAEPYYQYKQPAQHHRLLNTYQAETLEPSAAAVWLLPGITISRAGIKHWVPLAEDIAQRAGYPPVQFYWGQPAGYIPAQRQPQTIVDRLVSPMPTRTMTGWPDITGLLRMYRLAGHRQPLAMAKTGPVISPPTAWSGTPASTTRMQPHRVPMVVLGEPRYRSVTVQLHLRAPDSLQMHWPAKQQSAAHTRYLSYPSQKQPAAVPETTARLLQKYRTAELIKLQGFKHYGQVHPLLPYPSAVTIPPAAAQALLALTALTENNSGIYTNTAETVYSYQQPAQQHQLPVAPSTTAAEPAAATGLLPGAAIIGQMQQGRQNTLTRVIRLLAASQARITATSLKRPVDRPSPVLRRETQFAVYATGWRQTGQTGAQPSESLPAQLQMLDITSGISVPNFDGPNVGAESVRSTDYRTHEVKHTPGVVPPTFGIEPVTRYTTQPAAIKLGALLVENIAPQYGKVQIYLQRAQTNVLTAAQTPTGYTVAQPAGYIPVSVQLQPGQPTGYPAVQFYRGQPAGYIPAQGQPQTIVNRLVSPMPTRTMTGWPDITGLLRMYRLAGHRQPLAMAKTRPVISPPTAWSGTPASTTRMQPHRVPMVVLGEPRYRSVTVQLHLRAPDSLQMHWPAKQQSAAHTRYLSYPSPKQPAAVPEITTGLLPKYRATELIKLQGFKHYGQVHPLLPVAPSTTAAEPAAATGLLPGAAIIGQMQQGRQNTLTRVIRLLAASRARITATSLKRPVDRPGSVRQGSNQSGHATGRLQKGQPSTQSGGYLPAQTAASKTTGDMPVSLRYYIQQSRLAPAPVRTVNPAQLLTAAPANRGTRTSSHNISAGVLRQVAQTEPAAASLKAIKQIQNKTEIERRLLTNIMSKEYAAAVGDMVLRQQPSQVKGVARQGAMPHDRSGYYFRAPQMELRTTRPKQSSDLPNAANEAGKRQTEIALEKTLLSSTKINSSEIKRIADKVYLELERRIKRERQRRGL